MKTLVKQMSKILLTFFTIFCLAFIPQIKDNYLSKEDKKEGWTLLFDGKSTKGWHVFKKPGMMNPQWQVKEGMLWLSRSGGGDIVSDLEYTNFELNLEWRISPNGNSGIFFNVSEDTSYNAVYQTGPEMQILDDAGHPDGKIPSHTSGANYDLAVPKVKSVKPVGTWNYVRLIVKDSVVTQYLNGQITAKYKLMSPEWEAQVAKSKFKTMPSYGRNGKGHIALQDHGDEVWFKNIKIKKL